MCMTKIHLTINDVPTVWFFLDASSSTFYGLGIDAYRCHDCKCVLKNVALNNYQGNLIPATCYIDQTSYQNVEANFILIVFPRKPMYLNCVTC